MPRKILEEKLLKFLTEDLGQGDVTAAVTVPLGLKAKAEVISKDEGTVAGIEEAVILSEAVGLKTEIEVSDGARIERGQVLLTVSGDARTILAVERTMLNMLSRMSGIATATRSLVDKLEKAHSKCRVAATRKTALGLLYFDKKAIALGGGETHRLHLDDMILIKDNHIALAGSLEEAIKSTKQKASFSKKIEVEVTKPTDAVIAAKWGAHIIMLDNFSPQQVKEAKALLKDAKLSDKVLLEASGGITPENVLDYASVGVDIASLGALTHSVKALDISLEIVHSK